MDGRVDLEARIELAAQAVIDHGCDRCALRSLCRFLLNERSNGNEIIERQLRVRDLGFRKAVRTHLLCQAVIERVQRVVEIAGKFVVKVPQELINDVFRRIAHIELVRVREQIALQPVLAAVGNILQERIVKFIRGRRIRQLIIRADAVGLQQLENVRAFIALGDGDLDDRAVRAGLYHIVDECVIVIPAVQRIRPRLDRLFRVGRPAVELEQALVSDKALAAQLGRDLGDCRAVGDGHRDLGIVLRQCKHIVGNAPCGDREKHGNCKHAAHIEQDPDAGREPLMLFGRLLLLRLLLIDVRRQICIFFRDLRLKQRLHAALFGFLFRLPVHVLQHGLRVRHVGIGIIHHRVDAGQIVLDGRKQLVQRQLLEAFFQLAVFLRLGRLRLKIGVLFCHLFLPHAR